MAKQLNVDLNVKANTGEAKKQFQELSKSLSDVITNVAKANNAKINANSFKEAAAAAQELQRHLSNAVNIDTGKIDLNKFNTSLKRSNTDISQLSNKLLSAGKTGEQAFIRLAQSIAAADRPIVTLGSHLNGFLTTLKNTARWQISSSMLHGFIGALQSAYGYAQDLNKSLNNIRIVTGYNIDQMAEFAEQANKAAKALSTTTTDYTDAALIYYQQGIRDQDEIAARTETTIKLANVSRQSAEDVSSQMTAIWNNFADGSKSLEYYADVITALGASTASSSDEIAQGLQKFAAVADTVGLSYEKATSALATVVAETRQSADVVGTAFKTMFARFQGLSLGETLEDGVDLNKYSKALQTVGVNILDANGNLKEMDIILDETYERWNSISEAQRVALAETVAGTRQYAQFMAIMNNYDKILSNQKLASQSEGTLQSQADIYAQSWEAASKHVKASLQSIYQDLLDDKFFIKMTNGFSKLLNGLHNFIDGIGGIKGVLLGIGSFFLSQIAGKIQPALQNLKIQLTTLFQTPRQQAEAYAKTMNQIISQAKGSTNLAFDKMSPSAQTGLQYAEQLAVAKNKLMILDKQLTQEEKQVSEQSLSLIAAYYEETQAIADKVTTERENAETLMDSITAEAAIKDLEKERSAVLQELVNKEQAARDAYLAARTDQNREAYEEATQAVVEYEEHTQELASDQELLVKALANAYEQFLRQENGLEVTGEASVSLGQVLDGLSGKLNQIGQSKDGFKKMQSQIADLEDDLTQLGIGTIPSVKKAFEQCYKAGNATKLQDAIKKLQAALAKAKIEGKDLAKVLDNMGEGKQAQAIRKAFQELGKDEEKLKQQQEQLNAAFAAFNPTHVITGIERITATASLMGQVAMMATSLRSIFQAWDNDDMSFGEKLTTTFMSLSMIIPGVLAGYKSLQTVLTSASLAETIYISKLSAEKLSTEEAAAAKAALNTLRKTDMGTMTAEQVLKEKSAALNTLLTMSIGKEEIATRGLDMAKIAEAATTEMANGASKVEAITRALVTAGVDEETAAKWAAKYATDALNASTKAAMGVFGLILIAITAIVTALMAWANAAKKAAEEQRKQRQEAAETADKEIQKITEERKAVEKLYIEYANLKTHLGESTDAKEALRQKTKELCAALGVEWDALDELQGKYEDVDRAILETRRDVLKDDIAKTTENIKIANQYVEDVVDQNATLSEYDFGQTTRTRTIEHDRSGLAELFLGDYDLETYETPYLNAGGSTNVGNANLAVKNLFYDWMYDNYSEMLSEPRLSESASNYGYRGSTMYFQEGTQQNDIVGVIKEFASYLMTNSEDLGIDSDSAAYEWFKAFNGDQQITEKYNQIAGYNEELTAQIKELAQIEASLAGDDISSVNTKAEFDAYKANWIKTFKNILVEQGVDISEYTEDYFNNLADDYLGQFDNFNQIIQQNKLDQSLKTHLSNNNTDQEIQTLIESLTDEDYALLQLHPEIVSDTTTVKSLRNTLDSLQALADNEPIKTKISAVSTAQSALKTNMTIEDYGTIQNSGIDWGNAREGIIDFNQFIQLSYEEQETYLEQLTIKYNQQILANLQTSRQALNEQRKQLSEEQAKLQSDNTYDAKKRKAEIAEELKIVNEQLAENKTQVLEYTQILNNLTSSITQALENLTSKDWKIGLSLDAADIEQLKLLGFSDSQLSDMFTWVDENTAVFVGDVKEMQSALGDLQFNTITDQMNLLLTPMGSFTNILDFQKQGLIGVNEEFRALVETYVNSAISIDDLKMRIQKLTDEGFYNGEMAIGAYTNALISMGASFDNCKDELSTVTQAYAEYNDAISDYAQLGQMAEAEFLYSGAVSSETLAQLNAAQARKEAAEAALELANADLELSIASNKAAENFGLEAQRLENTSQFIQDAAESSDELADSLKRDEKEALEIAKDLARYDKALKSVKDNQEKWNKALKSGNFEDLAESIPEMAEAYGDLLDLDGSQLSQDFLQNAENLDLMKKAAEGSTAAYDELLNRAQDDMLQAHVKPVLDDGSTNELYESLNNLSDSIRDSIKDIEVGAELNDEGFLQSLSDLVNAAGMTAEEATDYLSSMGIDAEVEQVDTSATNTDEVNSIRASIVDEGNLPVPVVASDGSVTTRNIPLQGVDYSLIQESQPKTEEQTAFALKVTSAKKSSGGGFKYKNSTNGSGSGGKSSGGGGSKGTKASSHKHEVHRYSNEENTAKGLASVYDRINTAKDHAFGADRIRLMEKELTTLGKLKKAASDYLEAIVGKGNTDKIAKAVYSGQNIGKMIAGGQFGGTIGADYKSLFSGKDASGKGVEYTSKSGDNEKLTDEEYSLAALNALFGSNIQIELDSYGNITNKDALLDTIQDLTNATEDAYSAIVEPSDAQENDHNRRIAYLETLTERIDQYNETAELIQEKVDEYLDYIYQMQEKNADLITSRMDHGVELGDRSLKRLERAITILGDRIYKDAEAMSEWFNATFAEGLDADRKKADAYADAMVETMDKWKLYTEPGGDLDENAIDSEHAAEIMANIEDGYTALMEDVLDRIQQGREYYGDVLDYWNDKLDATTSLIEANANSLEHLQNVLGLLGRATDYKSLGIVLQGQYDVAKSNYEAQKAISDEAYREWQNNQRIYEEMQQRGASKDELEEFKTAALDKSEADYYEKLSNTQDALETALEKMNAYIENEINRIYQESEDRLVGKWGSFDALDAAMERQHNLADEYLTKTNQLYETNTLLRKLSQDIDKTDSAAAKAKLKAFSDEIEGLKEKNQLSKAELDIAKARYEVLLAQIALEEAQNAKSTVRLQRDSEGNYGYVYTADQDKVNDAEQNLADKQNDLYNLVLGQTQDYTEKIIQHTQERNEALQELDQQWLNGEITDYDEYLRLREDITTKYNDLIKTDYENYYRAVGWLNEVGAEGQTEAWTNSFTDILSAQDVYAEEIERETTNIASKIDGEMEWLNGEREHWTEEAKVGNKELGKTIQDVTATVTDLKNKITNDLVPAMKTAMDQAASLTKKFALQSDELKQLALDYKNAADQANAYYQTIASWTRTEETVPDDNTGTGDDNTGAGNENTGAGNNTATSGNGSAREFLEEVFWGRAGNGAARRAYFKALGYSDDEITSYQGIINSYYAAAGGNDHADEAWAALRRDYGFRTGGYTGEWGEEGKLAFLHQKELVLNAEDTKNILDAVALIREISSAIDLRAAASSLSAGLNSPYYQNSSSVVEQTVTIHAEFPNATDHNEIEEALNNLVNRAAQYASKNND